MRHLILNVPQSNCRPARVPTQELQPVAPPRTVDYEPERDELALLQVGARLQPPYCPARPELHAGVGVCC